MRCALSSRCCIACGRLLHCAHEMTTEMRPNWNTHETYSTGLIRSRQSHCRTGSCAKQMVWSNKTQCSSDKKLTQMKARHGIDFFPLCKFERKKNSFLRETKSKSLAAPPHNTILIRKRDPWSVWILAVATVTRVIVRLFPHVIKNRVFHGRHRWNDRIYRENRQQHWRTQRIDSYKIYCDSSIYWDRARTAIGKHPVPVSHRIHDLLRTELNLIIRQAFTRENSVCEHSSVQQTLRQDIVNQF